MNQKHMAWGNPIETIPTPIAPHEVVQSVGDVVTNYHDHIQEWMKALSSYLTEIGAQTKTLLDHAETDGFVVKFGAYGVVWIMVPAFLRSEPGVYSCKLKMFRSPTLHEAYGGVGAESWIDTGLEYFADDQGNFVNGDEKNKSRGTLNTKSGALTILNDLIDKIPSL